MKKINNLQLEAAKIAAKSTSRVELSGVLFENNKAVATDGFSLIEIEDTRDIEELEAVILDAKELKRVKTVGDTSELVVGDKGAAINAEAVYSIPVIPGQFPDYTALIPSEEPKMHIELDAKRLINLLKVMSIDGEINKVSIDLFGSEAPIKLTAESKEQGVKMVGLLMPLKQ